MVRFLVIVNLLYGLLFHGTPVTAASVNENDIMIVLSNSESMKNHDPESSTLQAISHFIQGSHDNTRVAILSFSEYVTVISPLTHIDLETIDELNQRINAIKPQGLLSNAAAAVERSIYELKAHAREGANKVIILITDTYIHTVDSNDDHKFEKWLREILVSDAVETGIQVFGIAIGEDADVQSLQILAIKTGGDYYQATTAHETQATLDKIHQELLNGGQKLAQAAEFSAIPLKNSVEPPPLRTTINPEMHAEDTWQIPPTADQENQAQQPHPTDIDPARRAPAHSLEPKTADPVSSLQLTAVEPTRVAWAAKNPVLLLIAASTGGLAVVIGMMWLLRRRRRTVLDTQNNQKTQRSFTPAAKIRNKETPGNTVIRSVDIALHTDTNDKTTIRSSNE